MRNIKIITAVIASICILASCSINDTKESQMPGSSGMTLEILLVTNENIYSGQTKDFIDSLFKQPQQNLNQPEPIFNIVNISPGLFNKSDLYKKHRNVIIIDVNSKNENKVFFRRDEWSYPQVVFQFSISNIANFAHYLPNISRK